MPHYGFSRNSIPPVLHDLSAPGIWILSVGVAPNAGAFVRRLPISAPTFCHSQEVLPEGGTQLGDPQRGTCEESGKNECRQQQRFPC